MVTYYLDWNNNTDWQMIMVYDIQCIPLSSTYIYYIYTCDIEDVKEPEKRILIYFFNFLTALVLND